MDWLEKMWQKINFRKFSNTGDEINYGIRTMNSKIKHLYLSIYTLNLNSL